MAQRIQHRSDTAANWTSVNPTLAQGEIGFETDTIAIKIGDGTTAWASLKYWHGKGKTLVINTTGGTTTLSQAEGMSTAFEVFGALTSNVEIIIPNSMSPFVAENETTGSYTVTFKTAAAAGIAVTQGTRTLLCSNGSIVESTATVGAALEVTKSVAANWAGRFENSNVGGFGILAATNSSGSSSAFAFEARDGANTLFMVKGNGNVGIGTATPNANALLDITSTTKAFMPPRMTTTQKNAIASPTAGMVVYDSILNKLCIRTSAAWETITSA